MRVVRACEPLAWDTFVASSAWGPVGTDVGTQFYRVGICGTLVGTDVGTQFYRVGICGTLW